MKNLTLNSRFIHAYNFRDPGATLDFRLRDIDACLAEGLVVLDANVLLLPLATGALTLSAIERVFRQLIASGQLFVPTHALREYLANRPTKIKELVDQLVKKKEKSYATSSSPLLQKADIFDELTEAEKGLKAEATKMSAILTRAITEIKGWETNDPVSSMYKSLELSSRLVRDPIDLDDEASVKAFVQENDDRCANKIPPGFKDSGKDENDIGDFLIWKTVLQLAADHPGRDLTFVSGEIKTDWLYRSAGQALHVREELIEEYRDASKGGSFHLIDLATLLGKFKESDQVVNEVRIGEQLASFVTDNAVAQSPKNWSEFGDISMRAVQAWMVAECSMTDVSASAFPFTHLQGDRESVTYLVYVRPVRHVEHIARRVRELRPKILSDVDIANSLSPHVVHEGGIVFVCENQESAEIAHRTAGRLSGDDFTVITGYVESGRFISLD